jgi:small subunit ribosomal protein S20
MPNIKSAIKRTRQNEVRRLRNRTKLVATRNLVKRFRKLTSKTEAQTLLPIVFSKLDKLAKHRIIHPNKASNQKSKLSRLVAKLA